MMVLALVGLFLIGTKAPAPDEEVGTQQDALCALEEINDQIDDQVRVFSRRFDRILTYRENSGESTTGLAWNARSLTTEHGPCRVGGGRAWIQDRRLLPAPA